MTKVTHPLLKFDTGFYNTHDLFSSNFEFMIVIDQMYRKAFHKLRINLFKLRLFIRLYGGLNQKFVQSASD